MAYVRSFAVPKWCGQLSATLFIALITVAGDSETMISDGLIDNRSSDSMRSSLGGEWRLVTDRVMGGQSSGELRPDQMLGRKCLRLLGSVSTANNGGFVQMTLDLAAGQPFDASAYAGLQLEVAGNDERYNVHLRTSDVRLPWQSYRASFIAGREWQELRIPFTELEAYRTENRFRPSRLVRIGLVAIGRVFQADLCLGSVRFYRDDEPDVQ